MLTRKSLNSLLLAVLCLAVTVHADQEVEPSAASEAEVYRWNEMLDSLRDLPLRVLEKLPESAKSDPEMEAEAARLALSALVSSGLSVLGADVDHPMFLPLNGPIFGTGQPNSDTIYRFAHIDPDGVYRIRGEMGSIRMASVGLHGTVPGDIGYSEGARPGPAKASYDLDSLILDDQGRFEVILSPDRPADYDGDWWKLESGTGKVMLRLVSADWQHERDPKISIERLDKPVRRGRISTHEIHSRLKRLSDAANFVAPLLVADHSRLRSEGYINKIRAHTLNRGMLPGQRYYYGAYELDANEALILEARVPHNCEYWSILLTNHLYETHDWLNNQSSLNDTQAEVEADGILRVVISERDPGVFNWLDTAGYPQGVIQGRWTNCDSAPVPEVKTVAVDQVLEYFPKGTTTLTFEEREQVIRDRRHAFLLRPLW